MINVDSTIQGDLVPASKAAKLLGVKRETLYAYASRGLLTRVPAPGGRGSVYLRSEVERLKARSAARSGHGAVAAGALRWGEPVLDSAITAIDAGGPTYRGHRAVDLARSGATFEQVAELLWTGELPAPGRVWRAPPLSHAALALGELLAGAAPVERLALLVPALAQAARRRPVGSTGAELARARRLIAGMASLLAPRPGESIAAAAARTLGARRSDHGALDRLLVLVADHELNASSFTARVAASAGAHLHACVSAALATVSGARHGGECDEIERFAARVREPRAAALAVRQRIEAGQLVPGFGHPLYANGDPRTPPLLEAARALSPRATATLDAIVDAASAALKLAPTLDVGLVAIARALGMPRGSAAALFALGRTAGWVAHVLEQRQDGYLLRPRARYVGVRAP